MFLSATIKIYTKNCHWIFTEAIAIFCLETSLCVYSLIITNMLEDKLISIFVQKISFDTSTFHPTYQNKTSLSYRLRGLSKQKIFAVYICPILSKSNFIVDITISCTRTTTLVSGIDCIWPLTTKVHLFQPVQALQLTPLLQFPTIFFLKSKPFSYLQLACNFGALLVASFIKEKL